MEQVVGPAPGGVIENLSEHLRETVTAPFASIPQSIFIYSTAQGKSDGQRRTDGVRGWLDDQW